MAPELCTNEVFMVLHAKDKTREIFMLRHFIVLRTVAYYTTGHAAQGHTSTVYSNTHRKTRRFTFCSMVLRKRTLLFVV